MIKKLLILGMVFLFAVCSGLGYAEAGGIKRKSIRRPRQYHYRLKKGVKKETSWIEIELVDEADRPVPGERYRIVLPNGTVKEGTLDSKGRARVKGIDPGNCRVVFPSLDGEAWER